ncbi:MAG TPA: sugar transferase [Candidatus Dormibacteraeota bacterium]|nr:sugar transferase [Candidatus Dormibacteraeota bacterium]
MPKSRAWRFLVSTLVVVDLACVLLGLKLAAWLASQPAFGGRGTPDWSFILLILPIFSLIFVAQGLYDPQNLLGGTREYAAVFRACTYGLLAIVLVSFVTRWIVSREWIVLSWAFSAALLGSGRFLIRRAAYQLQRRGHFTAKTIIVGANAHSLAVATQLSQNGSGVRIVGFLDDYVPAGSVLGNGHRVLGGSSALMQVAARTHADEAIVVPQALPWETLQTVLTDAAAAPNGLRVHLPAGFYDLLTTRVGLSERNHVPLLTVKKARLTPLEAIFKSSLDYGLSILMLVLLSPVMALAAGWLRLNGRSVIDRRRVVGQYGRPFALFSFHPGGPASSIFIRKLPGLVNVLRGELSIVGPRPMEGKDDRAQTRLLSIRPGLTGSWRQVSDADAQAVLDLYYIRSYSIWLDLQVLFQRVKARFG